MVAGLLYPLLLRVFENLPQSTLWAATRVCRIWRAVSYYPTHRRNVAIAAPLLNELLLLVFDFLYKSELRSAAQVCRSWRAAARDHPTYWRDIQIFTHSVGLGSAVKREQLHERLAHKPNASARFEFYDSLKDTDDELRAVLVPVLTVHVHRLVSLQLDLACDCGVVEVLIHVTAPVLQEFKLHFTRGCDAPTVLPSSVFTGSAPNLLKVDFARVNLLPDAPYPAFDAVTNVRCELRSSQPTFPPHFFSCFPAMQTLHIYTCGLRAPDVPPPDTRHYPLRRLEVYAIEGSTLSQFFVWLMAERLPELWLMSWYHDDAIPHVVRHLDPPFHVRAGGSLRSSSKERGNYVAVDSVVDAKSRVFKITSGSDVALYKYLFADLQGGALVQELSLLSEDQMDKVFGCVPVFPAVRILRFEWAPGERVSTREDSAILEEAHDSAARFPVLEELVLRVSMPAPARCILPAKLVSRMAATLFPGHSYPVRLTLQGVILADWDHGDLPGFGSVYVL